MVNYLVLFGAEELVRRGISTDAQANVLVHELFGTPSGEIYGYTGNSETAKKIAEVLRRRYGAKGRLKVLTREEVDAYYPQTWMV